MLNYLISLYLLMNVVLCVFIVRFNVTEHPLNLIPVLPLGSRTDQVHHWSTPAHSPQDPPHTPHDSDPVRLPYSHSPLHRSSKAGLYQYGSLPLVPCECSLVCIGLHGKIYVQRN